MKQIEKKEIIIAVPSIWRSLVPSLQSTAIADALLTNEFERLVSVSSSGTIEPEIAQKWDINKSFTKFTFTIDPNRTFFNGEKLRAEHLKTAWEHGLTLATQASNSSLQDVLYLTKNFDKFKSTGKLDGVKVFPGNQLEITFEKSFRTALYQFSAGRFSVFLESKGKYYGTGPYHIDFSNSKKIIFIRNPYNKEKKLFNKIKIILTKERDASSLIQQGKVDIFFFGRNSENFLCENKNISCISSFETLHKTISVNNIKGHLFQDVKLRLALQYLMYKNLQKIKYKDYYSYDLKKDFQSYLPFQQGRLDQDELKSFIDKGKKYLPLLLKESQKNPVIIMSYNEQWIKKILQ